MRTLLIVGTGELAREIVCSLAILDRPDLRLVIAGRTPARTAELAYLATARAATTPRRLLVETATIDVLSASDHGRLVDTHRPDCVVVCASLQSPWERLQRPSEWTRFLGRAGLAAALPLQAAIARRAALPAAAAGVPFLNACLPDAVNPLLTELGLPVFSGLGNVALIAASLVAALGLHGGQRLKVLAHHEHLNAGIPSADEAIAFVDDEPVSDVGRLLAGQRSTPRPALNALTGLVSARLLIEILRGSPTFTNLPGPNGLPGGYPVRIASGKVSLDLPPGLTPAAAIAANRRWAARSGVVLEDGRVSFGEEIRTLFGEQLPMLTEGFPVSALAEAEARLIHLQSRLRGGALPALAESSVRPQ
ncbi:hypothetical protein [Kribbella sp. NPDC051718]|uniref:hypothetical protein n=1 Tax=Kribbella sp. NPDC051718 TaxID=3155168 RepID=UPI0034354A97